MTEQIATRSKAPVGEGKYARVERELRFLAAGPPSICPCTPFAAARSPDNDVSNSG
jgi:hypothetical protein